MWSNKDKEVYEYANLEFSLTETDQIIDRTLIPEYFPPQDATEIPSPSDKPTVDDSAVEPAAPEAPVSEESPQIADVPPNTDVKAP